MNRTNLPWKSFITCAGLMQPQGRCREHNFYSKHVRGKEIKTINLRTVLKHCKTLYLRQFDNLWAMPRYGWDFPEEIPEEFRKDPGNALRAFPGIPLESTAGMPQTP